MTIAGMLSQRQDAAARVKFLSGFGRPLEEAGKFMLRRWCRMTVMIRIELIKRGNMRAIRHRLLSSAEIEQAFSLPGDRASVDRMMNRVCDDIRAKTSTPVSVVNVDDELVITFAEQ
jgi:hypothetical protein